MHKTIEKNLISYIKKLKEPLDYFKGTPPFSMELASNILLFARTKSSKLKTKNMHHHRYVLIMNFETEATAIINNMHFSFKPKTVLLIHPHEFHHFIEIKKIKLNWLFLTFELKNNNLSSQLKKTIIKPSELFWSFMNELILSENKKNQENKKILITSLIINELLEVDEKSVADVDFSKQNKNLISEINNYIYTNLKKGIDISVIAKKFCFSKSHLRLIYRQAMGISIGTYMKEIRTNEAEKLLTSSNMNISEIAYACGFESLFSFSRYFKRNTKMTPSSYRKKYLRI